MQTLNFDINGMTCGGSTSSVQRALSKLDGVRHAEVTLHPGTATVVGDRARASPAPIQAAITDLGYSAKVRPTAQNQQVPS